MILQVRSGRITASEGARILGISRKTYYQWEKRALEGMMAGLEQQPPGRPSTAPDREKEAMAREIVRLKNQLEEARQTAALRAALMPLQMPLRRARVAKLRVPNSKKKKNN